MFFLYVFCSYMATARAPRGRPRGLCTRRKTLSRGVAIRSIATPWLRPWFGRTYLGTGKQHLSLYRKVFIITDAFITTDTHRKAGFDGHKNIRLLWLVTRDTQVKHPTAQKVSLSVIINTLRYGSGMGVYQSWQRNIPSAGRHRKNFAVSVHHGHSTGNSHEGFH